MRKPTMEPRQLAFRFEVGDHYDVPIYGRNGFQNAVLQVDSVDRDSGIITFKLIEDPNG